MKRIVALGVLTIICLIAGACGPSPEKIAQQTEVAMTEEALTWTPTPPPTATPIVYNVTIEVKDEEGNPIPDAKIIREETLITDENGIWEGSTLDPDYKASFWAQGFTIQEFSKILVPGDNVLTVTMAIDPNGLQLSDLEKEGYDLVFVEDFQDGIIDCQLEGNGGISPDETAEGNNHLLVDLRNLDSVFSCSFGPENIKDAIIEMDFRYPDIRYNDFISDSEYNWQGYAIYFRDGADIEGYPINVPWGPTLQVRDYTSGEWKYPITTRQSIENNKWYTLSTNWYDTRVEVYMNNSLRFTYLTAPDTLNVYLAGIEAFGQAYIQFDNVKMWVPVN